MDDAKAAADIAGIIQSGGGLLLLGWAAATVRSAFLRWSRLAELQEKLMQAQLKALGDKPEQVPQNTAEGLQLLREIRVAVAR